VRAARLSQLFAAAALAVGVGSCGGDGSPIEPTPVCSVAIAPPAGTFASDGGSGSVAVTAAPGCTWTASTNADWIAVTSGTPGSGSGTVSYSVRANSATESRNGVLSIGDQNHTVTQDGRPAVICNYELAPDSATVGDGGGTQSFGVKAPAECAWSATSHAAWLTIIDGAAGRGNGTVSYSVAANNDVADRVGTIAVADRTFTVRQGGEIAACRYSVSPVQFSPCMPAGTLVASLTTEASCPWTATVDSSWINVPSGTSGRGSTTITIAYGENYDAPRHGIVMLRWPTEAAGQNIHVAQAGCVYAVSRATFSFTSAAGTGTFDVLQQSDPNTCGGATQDQCLWSAQATVPWITITSSMPRRGDNPVAFAVAANTTGDARTGTIAVRDKVVTITQGR
jgi:all-beta uncharacterized protein/BACON domain-containing protein